MGELYGDLAESGNELPPQTVAGLAAVTIRNGYETEVPTHLEIGLSILSKEADVGIATITASKLLNLPFIPITRERFDMILDRSTFFEKGIQAFIETLNSEGFRNRVAKLGSYDFKNSGKILYSQN